MGAWGIKNFENDEACDWVYELEKSKDKSVVNDALDNIIGNSEYVESPDCIEALAAAEIVLAGLSSDFSGITEEAAVWIKKKPGLFKKPIAFDSSDAKKSIEVIKKVITTSELKELWEETEDFDEWLKMQKIIIEKLSMYAN